MSTRSIENPLPGERVLALSPENAVEAATAWLRRPNLFPGRALGAATLERRQSWQTSHLTARGQDWVAGIREGLRATLTPVAAANGFAATRLTLEMGRGLAVNGEDVTLNRALECLLADVPVVAPPAFFEVGGGMGPADSEAQAGVLRPRGIGAALGELTAPALANLPRAGVLLLQPVSVDSADIDAMNPCERGCAGLDDAAAYEDWRIRDAARLLWYPWPNEWIALPGVPAGQLRNALAWAVFRAEAALPAGGALPWEEWGVPVAMLAFDPGWRPEWLDRAGVAREGGRARDPRLRFARGSAQGALSANSRLPALWQAQIEQFAEQVAAAGEPAPDAGVLADAFTTRLPPVGLLPRNAYDPANYRSDFFPPGFDLDAVAVPLEQLDVAVRQSAPLAPLDPRAPESVRILVPVPLQSWEPRLLHKEVIDPEFQETLDRFLLRRARSLGARQGLRNQAAMLAHALNGQAPKVQSYQDDALALERESLKPWGEPPPGGGHRGDLLPGMHQHFFDGASQPFLVNEGESLFAWVCLDPDHPPRSLMLQWHSGGGWEHRAYWGEDLLPLGGPDGSASHYRVGDLPTAGAWVMLKVPAALVGLAGKNLDGMAFTLYDGRAAYGLAGARTDHAWRKWFCNFLPLGARVQGDEAWDLLTANDLWAPFTAHDGVVPSLPKLLNAAPENLFNPESAATAAPALAVPGGGFNIYYPNAAGWRGHVLNYNAAPATAPTWNKGAADKLRVWLYLDELNPPRSIWAGVVCVGLNAGNTPSGAEFRLMYWGENHLPQLGATAPGFKALEAQTERAGGLPQSGTWVQLELPLPAGAKLEGATRLRLASAIFLAHGGTLAFSDFSLLRAAAPDAPESIWPLGAAGEQPKPPFTPYLNAKLQLQHNLGVLTPTPSSRIGTVRVYAELVGDPALKRLSHHEQSQLPLRGLSGFADYLRARIDRADDITDFGFTHMQVDMHRLRQLMMSTSDASRLAVSPALAAIAKSDSALTVQSQIKDYLAGVKAAARPASAALAGGFTAAVPKAAASLSQASAGVAVKTASLSTQAGLIARPRAPLNIVYANPVIGLSEIRTTAIADRLHPPPSTAARDYALANRHRTVVSLLDLLEEFLAEDSGAVPALLDKLDVHGLSGEVHPLTEFRGNAALLAGLLQPPPEAKNAAGETIPLDEAQIFTQTVSLSDNTIALLRQIEGRLILYRDALARCESALRELLADADTSNRRLQAVEDDLAESRHDVSVARALIAEENERIAGINARRARVLAEEVNFLAYIRPREADNLLATPTRAVDPGLLEAPVPACLRARPDTPEELLDMLRVVSEAPANWFVKMPPLVQKLDKIEHLTRLAQTAQARAVAGIATPRLAVKANPAGKLGAAISRVANRQAEALAPRLAAAQNLNLAAFAGITWQGIRAQAEPVVSFADLAEGGHGRADVARAAAGELENIRAVASCLHAEFSAVPPSLRLDWAETLSEFDASPNLRNLASLARWPEIGYIDRRQMQAYVDWLFAQIEPNQPAAVALINDVVRMCLLLASDAPIDRILIGRMARPLTGVGVGLRIPLTALEPARLSVGMQALLYRGDSVVARARIEDLGSLEISAQIIHTATAKVDLGSDVRVQFEHDATLSLTGAAAGRTLFKR